ncbi:TetR/AcrR family transcriptional regulator [Microaerobacter geothermalis]|uniref:TetR/AcrR family transcriptional regulator n=1 Tax=Microaerobacter geothermalis TaxID=674972 RepID=UPI001F1B54C0|nr:TetR/AcrR family transcriptional regulator [Microaerobacter geothermalis]MCF6095207.1 TetR/AcrR family transcriptional regulator [Microaerobacter geothermalis]
MEQKFEDTLSKWLEEIKEEGDMTEKQRKILEASIKLFSEKGFHASSTSEIAKEAGVAEGTIFRHFKTKKDILVTLLAPLFMKLLSPYILKDVKRIMEDESLSAEEVLKKVFKNRLDLLEKNKDRIKIIFQEATFHPEIKEAIVEHIARQARAIAEVFVTKKIKEGEFRDLPTFTVVRTAFSMMLGYVFFKYALFPDETMSLDEDVEIDTMIDIFLNGVRKKTDFAAGHPLDC